MEQYARVRFPLDFKAYKRQGITPNGQRAQQGEWQRCHLRLEQMPPTLVLSNLSVHNRVDALNFTHIYSGVIKQQDRWAQHWAY